MTRKVYSVHELHFTKIKKVTGQGITRRKVKISSTMIEQICAGLPDYGALSPL